MHAWVDGDVLVYAAGFASDAAAKLKLIRELGEQGYEEYVEQEGKPFESLHHNLHGLNMMLSGIRDTVDATRSTVFLSHPVNYREQMFPPYKMNRNTTHKPHWYAELKDYLLDKGAKFSEEGDEADDALGIAQVAANKKRAGDSIICTNDKDLDMIPGLHYNWSPTRKADGVYEIDEVEGLRKFYTQIITGDGTDNIPGMFKHTGKKAAAKYTTPIEQLYTEKDMYNHVLSVYRGDTDFVHMTGPLLWIKRDKNWWTPPN